MSTAPFNASPQDSFSRLRDLTFRACELARAEAELTRDALLHFSPELLASVREHEEELDSLDRQINEEVTASISRVPETQAREMLSFLKAIIELERIGDLLLNVAVRAEQTYGRMGEEDGRELAAMAGLVERMLQDVFLAYSKRDLQRALAILRQDAELDRMRNLAFLRHIENRESQPRREGFHVVFMAQTLERAGDHAKNLAEEVCQLATGRSIRHLLRASDKPYELMWAEWMKRQGAK
jgi:phosphate transport system protein